MKLNGLKSLSEKSKRKRLGRGNGSGKGTYSGRGIKGQKSRSGYKIPSSPIIAKLPKLRGEGFYLTKKPKVYIVNLETLEKNYRAGEEVSKESLCEKRIIRPKRKDKNFRVKILSDGTLIKKLKFEEGFLYSQKAKEKISK